MTPVKLRHHGGKIEPRLTNELTPTGESVRGDARTPVGVTELSMIAYALPQVRFTGCIGSGNVVTRRGGVA